MSNDQEMEQFAQQFQQAADSGGFNPLSLFTGADHLHSVFLAPFSPSMQEAIAQFNADGSGPLAGLVQQFVTAGHTPVEAATRARELLNQAAGMCVVVMVNEQGPSTIPQLFFGHLESDYQQHVIALCGDQFTEQDALRRLLQQLASAAKAGAAGPQLYASVANHPRGRDYWLDLAECLVEASRNQIMPGASERLRDLGHWIGAALSTLGSQGPALEGDDLLLCCHAQLLATDFQPGLATAGQLLSDYEPEDEALLELIERLTATAIKAGQPDLAVRFLDHYTADIEALLGGLYEWELVRFRALAASGADNERLLAQVAALAKSDRKSYRHDLNREPLWQVTSADHGPLLSVNQAAEYVDRSINFIAKRLDQGTIPFVENKDGREIPERALRSWKAIMDHHQLID